MTSDEHMTNPDVRRELDRLLDEWRNDPSATHTKIGQDSYSWFAQAVQLRRAAELLEPDMLKSYAWSKELDGAGVPPRFPIQPPVYGAYTLLSGLSLELLAKAVLIERNPTLVDQGRLTKWRDNGHGLVGLLEQVGILLDAEDIYLAERLGESVVWAGRYPIPWNASGMAPRQTPQGDMAAPGDFHPDRDPSRATVIWERLENALIREWQERAPLKAAAWHAIKTGELPGLPGIGMSKE
ncbi:MAG: hypothetical protein QOK46_1869 [Microbacteriaceae bacterium]|nr:hypothetical protein [Microbacteriaceae bacterium]